jgi:hypothetical protein
MIHDSEGHVPMDGHSMVLDVGVALHRDRLLGRRGGATV